MRNLPLFFLDTIDIEKNGLDIDYVIRRRNNGFRE